MHLKVNDEFLGVDNQMKAEKLCHWKKERKFKMNKNKDQELDKVNSANLLLEF